MPRIYSRTQKIHKKFITCTQPFFEDPKNKEVYDAVKKGRNTYLRIDRTETTDLDLTWVQRIEECIPQLAEIVKNPRRTMKTFNEVVQVEKAKKITSESVVHLASHTQFVKTVDEYGNVTPNKILNIYNDDNFKMYENKFIATLIRRLNVFVEKRYDFILNNAQMIDVSVLYYKGETEIDDSTINIETKVKFTKPCDGDAKEDIKKYLKRINEIRKYLRYFYYTEFMKVMNSERDVRNPILQTNIIRKNPTYRKCYHLWCFIDKYATAGVDVKVKETVFDLDKNELENINKSMFVDYITLRAKDNDSVGTPKYKSYTPRILKTLDDEVYTFASLYDGPVDYVRVDDKYREFMERLKDVPKHPTKSEQKYFKKEIESNRVAKETSTQIDSLIKRREQEAQKYLKETEELLARQRKEKEAAKKQKEIDAIRAQEQRIEDARSLLKNAAVNDFGKDLDSLFIDTKMPEPEEELISQTTLDIDNDYEYDEEFENEEEKIDENFVLPTFKEVYGEDAEKELANEVGDGLNPLFDKPKEEEKEEEEKEVFDENGERHEEFTTSHEDLEFTSNPLTDEDKEELKKDFDIEEFDFNGDEFNTDDSEEDFE